MKSTGEAWMGTVEAAEHLGVTLRTLYRLIDTGQLPAYKFGRVIRLRREEVDRFVSEARISPGQLAHLYPQHPPGGGEDVIYLDEGSSSSTGDPVDDSVDLREPAPAGGRRPGGRRR